jgi:transaldolase
MEQRGKERRRMKIFIDTANLMEIKKAKALGLVDGVTTNPTLLAKEKENPETLIRKISEEVKGPINVEAKILATWGEEIVIKIPVTEEGLRAVRSLSQEGIKTNVTLIFSPGQAILAAKAGATYICPFLGRLDDISFNGLELIQQIREIYQNYDEFQTQIIVASVRHPIHVIEAARMGAEIVTIPPAILEQMVRHPLTDRGISQFLEDAKRIGGKR